MFKKIFRTLSPKHRKQFYRLQIVNIFVAIFEVASVASVGPFVLLASNPEKIFEHQWLHNMYLFSGVDSSAKFLSIIAVLAFLLLLTGALLSILLLGKYRSFHNKSVLVLAINCIGITYNSLGFTIARKTVLFLSNKLPMKLSASHIVLLHQLWKSMPR